jgi:hypothetical protein
MPHAIRNHNTTRMTCHKETKQQNINYQAFTWPIHSNTEKERNHILGEERSSYRSLL